MTEAAREAEKLGVFSSYSREDLGLADQLVVTLELVGFAPAFSTAWPSTRRRPGSVSPLGRSAPRAYDGWVHDGWLAMCRDGLTGRALPHRVRGASAGRLELTGRLGEALPLFTPRDRA